MPNVTAPEPMISQEGAPLRLGFLGVGTLTEAVVTGLRTYNALTPAIHLSPRSERTSAELARRFQAVVREPSNEAVIDCSDIVCLAMRPQQLDEALALLRFRPEQIVTSFVAGVGWSDISALVAPAGRACRVTPLPSIARRKGPISIFPMVAEVADIFAGLGDVIAVPDEAGMMTLGCVSGLLSTYYGLQNSIVAWLEGAGVERSTASLYTRSMLEGLAAVGRGTADEELEALPGLHQTKDGLNERCRERLTARGWFDAVGEELEGLRTGIVLRAPGED